MICGSGMAEIALVTFDAADSEVYLHRLWDL
jgi:hypothetical protein